MAEREIVCHSRNASTASYSFFKERALGWGDYKDNVKEHGGSTGPIKAVAGDKGAITYGGIGDTTADVRIVAIAGGPGKKPIAATVESAYCGEYPLMRHVYLVLNLKPGAELDSLHKEYIKF